MHHYTIDLLLKTKSGGKVGVEIFDPSCKWFRSKYPSAIERIRTKVLGREGIQLVDICFEGNPILDGDVDALFKQKVDHLINN